MNENRWKLWRMYAAGLPAMQFRNCRDAFYRTQMESPENTDPDRWSCLSLIFVAAVSDRRS
jgi:hypothetical protein